MKLEDHPLFLAFSEEQAKTLRESTRIENYEPNAIIFEEGSPSHDLYIIINGEVRFAKHLSDGKEQEISLSKAGEIFGEIGVVTKNARSLHAIAQTAVSLGIIPGDVFLECIGGASSGPIGQIFSGIIKHLHLTTDHYIEDIVEREKMAIVGTMINGLLHDFKNPFSIINMSSQLIAQEHKDNLTLELCQNIEDQITHMLEMATEISEFSQGKKTFMPSPSNLANLFERFRELNPLLFEKDGVELKIDVPSIDIEVEDVKLLRAIQNLVVNGIDACQPMDADGSSNCNEGKNCLVKVSAEDRGETVLIKIEDNGKGIPAEIQGKFFKPFVTKGKAKGTGLGTAIVKSIIDNHSGSIRFETEADKGTTFYITLPKRHS